MSFGGNKLMRAFMEKRHWPIFSGVGIKEREQLNESGGEKVVSIRRTPATIRI